MSEGRSAGTAARRLVLLRVFSVLAAVGAVAVLLTGSGTAQAVDSRPSASASTSVGSAAALADGDVAAGVLGAEWAAAGSDSSPWVQLSWTAARRISSVQIFGSTATAFDPQQSTAAALYGTLRFSDGSSVVVSGIAPGSGMPTTVAFPARSTTSVRLDLRRQIATAPVALRELTAYDAGVTPPRWTAPTSSPSYLETPPVASCSAASPSVAPVLSGRFSLACPTPGSSVRDSATVVVNAPPGTALTAWATGSNASSLAVPLRRVARGTADGNGRAVLVADLRRLAQGPVTLKVTVDPAPTGASTGPAPLYVQLFHGAGAMPPDGLDSRRPPGLTLQYSDDFRQPLSISQTGWGTQYAAVKPEPWGGSQFGDAVFADPAWGAGTLATLPGGFLRIRTEQIGSYTSKQSWNQQHISGILSSQRFGGSGFSAQYGYFEARILGAPGPGAWPAFWMLNSESGTGRAGGTTGELDAVELYGHDTNGACHTTHSWAPTKKGELVCHQYPLDWAAEWHTYGVQVLPGGAEFFLDGEPVATLDELSHTDQPFFFMLNLATGGGWPVDLAATGQTTDMYVDWVRVWT